jgi:hypothetical protein
VFASKAELDAWLARTIPMPSKAEPLDNLDDIEEPSTELVALEAQSASLPWRTVGLGMLVVCVGLLAWHERAAPVVPLALTVVGEAVEARGADSQLVWRHELGRAVSRIPDDVLAPLDRFNASVADVDLDGDGAIEHVLPVRFGAVGGDPSSTDGLLLFRSDGGLLWSFQPEYSFTCGGQVYGGPWRLKSVVVSSEGAERRLWASYIHHTWWPSFVVEITFDGHSTLKYFQTGWVMSLAEVALGNRTLVAAAGVLNDVARPSLVLFDPDQERTMLPAATPEFACDVAAGGPDRAILFPMNEVATAHRSPYVIAHRVQNLGGSLRVEVDGARMLAFLDGAGRVNGMSFSDSYFKEHEGLTGLRLLNHQLGLCPEQQTPAQIEEWTPDHGWQTYGVPLSRR